MSKYRETMKELYINGNEDKLFYNNTEGIGEDNAL